MVKWTKDSPAKGGVKVSLGDLEVAATSGKVYTYADYCQLPEGAPYQLIGGKLILTPSPTTYHQMISARLEFALMDFVKEHTSGIVLNAPIDVYFSPTETYQPDIIFISQDRMSIIEPKRINGAPDLIIEILSPATAYYDLRHKFRVYERYGVKEYWIVDPEESSIEVFVREGEKFSLGQRLEHRGQVTSRLLPGLALPLESIFEGIIPASD